MGVGKTGMNQYRDSISVWKVYLPIEYDREKYIRHCFLTGTVTLINENAESVHNVKVGKMTMKLIDFPADEKSFGSEVVCVTLPYSGEIRVVDVYVGKTEFDQQGEHQIKLSKSVDGEHAQVLIDGKRGRVAISVDSDDDQGEVNISVTNSNRTGKLSVNVNGEIMVVNDGKTTVQSSQEIQLEQYDDEADERTSVNIKKDQVLVTSKKILLNDSDEPVLLGNKTVSLMKEILDQLGKESAGPYPLVGRPIYTQIAGKLEELKSQLSFVK
jgi:stress response protein YsnF